MGRQTTRAVEHSLPPPNKLYTYNRYSEHAPRRNAVLPRVVRPVRGPLIVYGPTSDRDRVSYAASLIRNNQTPICGRRAPLSCSQGGVRAQGLMQMEKMRLLKIN